MDIVNIKAKESETQAAKVSCLGKSALQLAITTKYSYSQSSSRARQMVHSVLIRLRSLNNHSMWIQWIPGTRSISSNL